MGNGDIFTAHQKGHLSLDLKDENFLRWRSRGKMLPEGVGGKRMYRKLSTTMKESGRTQKASWGGRAHTALEGCRTGRMPCPGVRTGTAESSILATFQHCHPGTLPTTSCHISFSVNSPFIIKRKKEKLISCLQVALLNQ